MARVYIGIGSNVGNCTANVQRAIDALHPLGAVVAVSSLFRTKPWGLTAQPDFINAVAALETELQAEALLDNLKRLEADLGRTETLRWGPRVIDLDLLTYGDAVIETRRLRIPHPQLRNRAFVLVPLAEIDGSYAAARDALPPEELAGVVRLP